MDLPLDRAQDVIANDAFCRNRLLASLPSEDRVALVGWLEPVELALQTELITAHRPLSYAYFPTSGLVSVMSASFRPPAEIGLIGREGVVGLAAVLGSDTTPHHYVVQAPGTALRIGMPALLTILCERPSLFRSFRLFAHVFMTQVGQTACANANLTIPRRLARWLLMAHDRLEGDEITFTHTFLSMMLGVRRPGVTIALHVLEGNGSIRTRRGHITIANRDKLVELAGVSYGVAEAEYERLLRPAD